MKLSTGVTYFPWLLSRVPGILCRNIFVPSLFGENMVLIRAFLLIWGANVTFGAEKRMFLDRYRDEIQEFIMTGHEKGWKNCDILSSNTLPHDREPHFSMDLEYIKTMDIKTTFASSSCLLVSYDVEGNESLSTLFDFGWSSIQFLRLALVMKMNDGTNLNMIGNTTKLPFLIAAELEQGKKQFLCPVVGKIAPVLEQEMCDLSHVSYQGKQLRISHIGLPPQFIFDPNSGIIDGTTFRMMRILEEKLNFNAQIIVADSFDGAIAMV